MGDRGGIEARLARFIVERLLDDELQDVGDPLAADAVDSLGLEQLVEFIEREFGVVVEGKEVVRKNFGSVPALAALVDSKIATDPADR